jgi:hypothetical protein
MPTTSPARWSSELSLLPPELKPRLLNDGSVDDGPGPSPSPAVVNGVPALCQSAADLLRSQVSHHVNPAKTKENLPDPVGFVVAPAPATLAAAVEAARVVVA